MQQIGQQPAFELGQIVAKPGAFAVLKKAGQQPGEFLTRHVNREWGDILDDDRNENEYSLEHGFRFLSAYKTSAGDRLGLSRKRVTTLLLPKDASRIIGTREPSSRTKGPRPRRCESFADGLRGKSILTSQMRRLTHKTKSYCHQRERAPVA